MIDYLQEWTGDGEVPPKVVSQYTIQAMPTPNMHPAAWRIILGAGDNTEALVIEDAHRRIELYFEGITDEQRTRAIDFFRKHIKGIIT